MFNLKYKSKTGTELEVSYNENLWVSIIKAIPFIELIKPFLS